MTQPHPIGGHGDCWGSVLELVGPGHWLYRDMSARRQLGIDRYGQPLRHGDGRDDLRDLREELLDVIAYAFRVHGEWGALQALRLTEALWRRGGRGTAEAEAPASVGGGDPQPLGLTQPEAVTPPGPSAPWAPDESY